MKIGHKLASTYLRLSVCFPSIFSAIIPIFISGLCLSTTVVQRRHYFWTIRSDVGQHLIILSDFSSMSCPPIVQKGVSLNWVQRRFSPIDYSLNPDPDLVFGSAISLNFDLNLGLGIIMGNPGVFQGYPDRKSVV